jgi:hypothetical protein
MSGAYGESGPWGVWLDKDGVRGEPHWFEHHRGGPNPYTEDHARALADTLNRGGLSGMCEARPIPADAWSKA